MIDVTGPFLAEPVLNDVFPQGLEAVDGDVRSILRRAYEELSEVVELRDPDAAAYQKAWIELVLATGLDYDADVLKEGQGLSDGLVHEIHENGVVLKPDWALVDDQSGDKPLLLIVAEDIGVDLNVPVENDRWAASPIERMIELCRATGIRLGLVTNGDHWTLVDAPVGGVPSIATWHARLWAQEPLTLQAFVNLLGIRRFFYNADEQLPSLLERSLDMQDDVTDALGEQVRRAVEVLIQAFDREDVNRNRELLKGIEANELYEAGLTVMMRIVFLLSAEERGLLLLGDDVYEANYAVSTLRSQLRESSEEILELRWDAWSRLLAVFRAVYAGIDHESLRMPALGGSLFDPDRFPFLEGRTKGSTWRTDMAVPLPIDNRTVLLLLEAVQLFQGRTLSYRTLDVEQIGYVYEGLLERTALKATEVTLDLDATKQAKKPWVTLDELENAASGGKDKLVSLLAERMGSSASRVENDLVKQVDEAEADKLLTACHADVATRDRVRPYFHLLRTDPWGYPLVYPKNTFMVATGADRRDTGTHYTPKSLTEAIVKETLEPVVYVGPAEGTPRTEWRLKSPKELLDLKICDPAMGSGAFLVQVCRWLGERLVEAWEGAEAQGLSITEDGRAVADLGSKQPLTKEIEERLLTARRLIAERCLYGVDLNPLAVELAKLSIWLVTLAKGRPFGFLDHNLKSGDSLLGVTSLDQLYSLELDPGPNSTKKLFAASIDETVNKAISLRQELRSRPIVDIRDVEVAADLDRRAQLALDIPILVGDAIIGDALAAGGTGGNSTDLSFAVGEALKGDPTHVGQLRNRAREGLSAELSAGRTPRRAFHWVVEFPEVFSAGKAGFDAIVGNPPFLGGQKLTGVMGECAREYCVNHIAGGQRGSADLVAYFFLRAYSILGCQGKLGLIAVNTIAEGNTREVGLERLLASGGDIFAAYPSETWPGSANVVTSRVHLSKNAWLGSKSISGRSVNEISAHLTNRVLWNSVKLKSNSNFVFQGCITLGDGFLTNETRARELISNDAANREILFPYLIGRDVNQTPTHQPSRWVISFFDWNEVKAKQFGAAYEQIRNVVKPVRQRLNDDGEYELRKPLPQRWWQYAEKRPALFHAVGRGASFENHPARWSAEEVALGRVIVFATGATKYPCFTLVPNEYIYANTLCVVASESYCLFACLSSDFHAIWAFANGSRLHERLRYTHGDVFETFPFPGGVLESSHNGLEELGLEFFEQRRNYMVQHDKGMTAFYNDFHDPSVASPEMEASRALQIQINDAVLRAYGFEDLDLNYGYHEVAYLPEGKNLRLTMSEAAREEVLSRLTSLNKERHELEAAASKTKRKSSAMISMKKKRSAPKPDNSRVASAISDLFASDEKASVEAPKESKPEPPAERLYNWLYDQNGRWVSKADAAIAVDLSPADFENAVETLTADEDLMVRGDGDAALLRVKG
nr:type IIL restriction-modification enzyme MmeI [Ruegeria arenilitoris]